MHSLESAGKMEGIQPERFGDFADNHPPAIQQGRGVAHAAAEQGMVRGLVTMEGKEP